MAPERKVVPPERVELSFLASEASTLSTELQGRYAKYDTTSVTRQQGASGATG